MIGCGVMKLGTGYYSLARIDARIERLIKRLIALQELHNRVSEEKAQEIRQQLMARLERQALAYAMREAGCRYREIAEELKVTRQRAIQIVQEVGSSTPSAPAESSRHTPDLSEPVSGSPSKNGHRPATPK